MKNKVLFISHDATRTGGGMLLFNILKWIKIADSDLNFSILCVRGGDLVKDFMLLAPTFVLNNPGVKNANTFTNRLRKKLLLNRFKKQNWDLIFTNTMVNGHVLNQLNPINIPVVAYIHELEYVEEIYKKHFGPGAIEGTMKFADYFLCGSYAVKKYLLAAHNIQDDCSEVVYSSWCNLKENNKNNELNRGLREELQIPIDAMVVGMMGAFDWRKGSDYFIQVAARLKNENIFFMWVGATDNNELLQCKFDAVKLSCIEKLRFIPPSTTYNKYFNCMDLFFLASREDPYPLVVVEASSYNIPIVCFDNAGGIPEFVEEDAGIVVPYGDYMAAATAIISLKNNEEQYNKLCAFSGKKSIDRHDVEVNGKKLLSVIYEKIKANKH